MLVLSYLLLVQTEERVLLIQLQWNKAFNCHLIFVFSWKTYNNGESLFAKPNCIVSSIYTKLAYHTPTQYGETKISYSPWRDEDMVEMSNNLFHHMLLQSLERRSKIQVGLIGATMVFLRLCSSTQMSEDKGSRAAC